MLRDQQSCSVERGDKMCSVSCSSPAPFIIAVFGSGTEDKCVKTAFIMCSTGKNTLRYEMLESFSVHLLWLQCFSRKELFLWLSKLSQAFVKYLSLSIHQSCCSLEVKKLFTMLQTDHRRLQMCHGTYFFAVCDSSISKELLGKSLSGHHQSPSHVCHYVNRVNSQRLLKMKE